MVVKIIGIVAGLIVGGLLALNFLPAARLVEEVVGVDSHAYHRPFFGERTAEHSFTVKSPTLAQINVLVVDFKRQVVGHPLTLRLFVPNAAEPVRTVVMDGAKVRDDYYLPFAFEPLHDIQNQPVRFVLSAPAATAEAPYAVRLTEDKTAIAFRYHEQTTQLSVLRQWSVDHRGHLVLFGSVLVIMGLSAWLIPQAAIKRQYLVALLVVILVLGSLLQWQVARQLVGDPGGDSYYYLVAAHQLAHGENPLAEWSFRLPFYSVLLMPAVLPGVPDLEWGRWLGIITTIGVGAVMVLLAQALGVRPVVGLVSFGLLYLCSDFIVTSVRPRPHTLHTLLLLSLTLFFRLRTMRQVVVWGVVLGLAGMTRQEAYVPIALLGMAFVVQLAWRRLAVTEIGKYIAAAGIPCLLIISPYLYQNYKQFGNPFDSPYFHKSDTPQARSVSQLIFDNGAIAGQRLSHAWLAADKPNVRSDWERTFAVLVLVFGAAYFGRRFVSQESSPLFEIISGLMAVAVMLALYQWIFRNGNDWNQQLNLAFLALATVGLLELLRVGRWRTVFLLVVILTQFVLATWYNPIARLFQAVYPVVALAAAVAAFSIARIPVRSKETETQSPRWRQTLRLSPFVAAIAFLGVVSVTHFSNAIDEVNFPAAPYYITTAAAERLEKYPPGVGAEEVEYGAGDGMYRLHSYQQRSLLRFPEEVLSPAEQWHWLCENNVRYVVDHDDLSYLTVHEDLPYKDNFRFRFETKAFGRNSYPFRTRVFELIPCVV